MTVALPARPRKVWRDVDGVLFLDKPQGISSNGALQRARRLFSAAKGGHAGTLDPMATGLLPICFGEATKFSADLLDADKSYETEICLGKTTDTGDADGLTTQIRPVRVSQDDIHGVLPRFIGEIQQKPPMYSALKRDGRPLYELARQGIEVEREPRLVCIRSIEYLAGPEFSADGTARLRISVSCSKGTYIRVLGEEIGEALGCGAHLTQLRRLGVGPLTLAGSVTLSELEAMDEAERLGCLQPVDSLLRSLPMVTLTGADALRFRNGNPVAHPEGGGLPDLADAGGSDNPDKTGNRLRRVYLEGVLLGVGEADPSGLLCPKRLLRRNPDLV